MENSKLMSKNRFSKDSKFLLICDLMYSTTGIL